MLNSVRLTFRMKCSKGKSEKQFNNDVSLLQQDILINELPNNHYDIVICAFGLKTLTLNNYKFWQMKHKTNFKNRWTVFIY